MRKNKKNIVISGVNIRKGGPLTIFYSLLDFIVIYRIYEQYNFILLCNNSELFSKYSKLFDVYYFPKANNSFIYRFYYDYFYFKKFSAKKTIHLWISLNDKTPRVIAKHQITYCHNASMFYRCTLKDIYYSPVFFIYTKFYKYLYKLNIQSNDYVLVQQKWIADEFERVFGIKNTLVVPPENFSKNQYKMSKILDDKFAKFIYPTTPRTYKNIELLFKVSKKLNELNLDFKLYLTFTGNENRFAKAMKKKFSEVTNVNFVGFLDKKTLYNYYNNVDVMLFPSKLETWGLPLTEFSTFDKPIFASNLRYAQETLKSYNKVYYFDPENENELFELMLKFIKDRTVSLVLKESMPNDVRKHNWMDIFDLFRDENE